MPTNAIIDPEGFDRDMEQRLARNGPVSTLLAEEPQRQAMAAISHVEEGPEPMIVEVGK